MDYLTNFSITYLVELPKPFGFIFLWVILFPSIFALSSGITGFVLRDWVIVKAPCPNCGAESNAFFGDIFTVSGPRMTNDVECGSCNSLLKFDNAKRTVSVERVGPAPAPAGKKGGKKKGEVSHWGERGVKRERVMSHSNCEVLFWNEAREQEYYVLFKQHVLYLFIGKKTTAPAGCTGVRPVTCSLLDHIYASLSEALGDQGGPGRFRGRCFSEFPKNIYEILPFLNISLLILRPYRVD